MMISDMESNPKAAVRNYFDRDVVGYLGAYSWVGHARGEIFRERRRLVLELVRKPIGRVLDVGSGPGIFTEALLEMGGDCWVVDLSPKMVIAGRDQLVGHPEAYRVHHEVADVEFLPFRDRIFDTVLCVGVLQYLSEPDAALRELARVTRLGGQVIISFLNRQSPLNVIHRGVVSALRAGRAGLRRVGIEVRPLESRLTFRDDIPNMSFVVGQIEVECGRVGLRPNCFVYQSLHFPFAIPGLRGPLRAWDHIANGLFRLGWLRTWGREAIIRLIRDE